MFAKTRFQGLDLDLVPFSYHVLFNSLVEEHFLEAAEAISKQISIRGFDTAIIYCIRIKSLCKQGRLNDGEAFLRQLDTINEHIIGVLLNALCKQKCFDDAWALVEEFGKSGRVPMAPAPIYRIWIGNLLDAEKVDGALDSFKSRKTEGYIPETLL